MRNPTSRAPSKTQAQTTRALQALALAIALTTQPAQASPSVEVTDPAYRDIDKLIASDLINDAIYSQRPWTRQEFARLTLEAETALPVQCPACPHRSEIIARLERLKTRFEPEISVLQGAAPHWNYHPIDRAQLLLVDLSTHPRAIPVDNGMGSLDATVEPMTANTEGLKFSQGANLLIRTDHWASYPGAASFYVQPDIMIPGGAGGAEVDLLNFHKLYITLDLGPVDLEFGRDTVVYGFGEHGGALLSDNARPFDMLKVGLPSPVILPGFLAGVGPFRGQIFVADLGSNRESPHAKLMGQAITARPFRLLEIGINHSYIIGGDKRQDTQWYNYLSEWFFLRPGFGLNGDYADHRIGGTFRLKLPFLANAELDFEMVFEDLGFDSIAANLSYRKALLTGLYFPIFLGHFDSDFRLQYYNVSPLVYRHGGFFSGYQIDRKIIGLASGNASSGVVITYGRDLDAGGASSGYAVAAGQGSRFLLHGYYEDYVGGTYNQIDETHMKLIQASLIEHRLRFDAELDWRLTPALSLKPKLGYEFIWNYGFQDGNHVTDIVGSLWLTWRPAF